MFLKPQHLFLHHFHSRKLNRKNRILRNGLFAVFTPGETVPELRVRKLVESASRPHAEITPDVFTAAEVQLLHRT